MAVDIHKRQEGYRKRQEGYREPFRIDRDVVMPCVLSPGHGVRP